MCLNTGGKSISQFLSSHKTPPVCRAPDPMFTEEDDTQILELYTQHERKWTVIAKIKLKPRQVNKISTEFDII